MSIFPSLSYYAVNRQQFNERFCWVHWRQAGIRVLTDNPNGGRSNYLEH